MVWYPPDRIIVLFLMTCIGKAGAAEPSRVNSCSQATKHLIAMLPFKGSQRIFITIIIVTLFLLLLLPTLRTP